MGVEINEFYGQTEANLVVGNCGQVLPISRGSMGKPIPGHRVAVVDAEGNACPPDTVGEIAVRRPDPVMFLNYWRNPRATASKFVDALPLTNTGKIIRGELRRREVEKQR
jgi:acetyl-CoA synthetase